ncbi:DUF4890 domain-containing protein [Leptobacterium flavescens]|uniref:DUF4890 domain-containing protein n=1 Tax=Leptobacterium flavescens TaxID=472055 RepID=A0A6P0UWW3_9FLAO|nr:DUF4890 domain-containing protein [Leptobacterium flavescens]NER14936.1 DUF4890 domain-containing protein [Leptobacterium flavescens]
MKKVIGLLLVMCFALPVMAQEEKQERRERKERTERKGREHRRAYLKDLSPEEIATLQTKRMAIALDLNENQKDQLLKLNTELATKRKQKAEALRAKKEKGEELSKDERYALANERLDAQYEVQQRMKQILNAEQYEKWQSMKKRKGKHIKRKKAQHHKKRGQ